ncbi:alpha/beta hydrolase [Actinocorallia lasiicapitis]
MLALASAVLLTLSILPVEAAAAKPRPALEKQKLSWKSCHPTAKVKAYRRLQCAKVKVPADWNKPKNGKTITLRISRLKATGKSEGVVFTNPGGPGAVGYTLPLAFIDAKRTNVLRRMDVIGIDVRGTGYSKQLHCSRVTGVNGFSDSRDRSAKNVAEMLKVGKAIAKSCQSGGGAYGKTVNTVQTVKDLDLIRAVLKQKKINWVGYSAGTWLGAYYAAYFPKRTGRFVLDSVVDFTGSWQRSFDRQPQGFERRFREDFAPFAAKHDAAFGLGGSADQVIAAYEKIRKRVVDAGRVVVVTEDDVIVLYPDDIDTIIAGDLYSKYYFPDTASFLGFLNIVTDPAQAGRVRQLGFDPTAGEDPTFFAIQCNDTKFSGTSASVVKKTEQLGAKYPLLGWGWTVQPCLSWKRPALSLKRPNFAKGPRLLLVQSEHDPATPIEGALAVRKAYKNSRMITVKGEGDHAIYAGDNACVDKLVESYLLDGKWPAKDASCDGYRPNGMRTFRQNGAVTSNALLRNQEIAQLLN